MNNKLLNTFKGIPKEISFTKNITFKNKTG